MNIINYHAKKENVKKNKKLKIKKKKDKKE